MILVIPPRPSIIAGSTFGRSIVWRRLKKSVFGRGGGRIFCFGHWNDAFALTASVELNLASTAASRIR